MKKIAVIGAGPAGLSAAIAAAKSGAQVDLYDHNEKIGKKLFITGKGRCNITNAVPIEDFFDKITTNKSFLYSSLYTFTNEMLIEQMEEAGCPLKVERGGRVFPKSDKSSDILKAFDRLLKKNHVNVLLGKHISSLIIEDGVCLGIVLKEEKLYYDAVILCSGGVSYTSTGSDGSGYKIAEQAGHTIIQAEPSLIGLRTKERWPSKLSGLTLTNVGLKLFHKDKLLFSERGEALFTHDGVSGPLVLSASSFVKKPIQDYKLVFDLKPGLTTEKLDKRVQRDLLEFSNKIFQNTLVNLLPKNLIPIIVEESGIKPGKRANIITREERGRLVYVLKHLTLTVSGTGPMEGAIITRGGVSTKEIDPGTLESRVVKNLYFAGEIIDVDALTGGYNIQIACSTGNLAGQSAAEKE